MRIRRRTALPLALCALIGGGPVLAAALAEPATASPVAASIGTTATAASTATVVSGTGSPRPVAPKIHDLTLKVVPSRLSAAARSAGTPVGPAVLTAPSSTASFQTVGVSWSGESTGDNLLITVRTHDAQGWSTWQTLSDDSGDDPTAAGSSGARGGTDPLWVGPSNGAQARIVLKSGSLPRDLKLELVDSGSSSYDATAAATPPGATTDLAAVTGPIRAGSIRTDTVHTAATAGVPEPAVLSRAQWGADESLVRATPTYMPTLKAFILHHTAGPNNYTAAQVPAIIRGDYAYHLSRGWNDIGYNALVDRFGRIWEGRAGGLSQNVMGAHAGGFDTDTFGVAMIGNYDTAHPSAAAVSAVAAIMAWKLDLNHRDPMGTTTLTSAGGGTARWKAGVTRTFPVIMGHRDTGFTDCPGRYLYPYLASIRSQVKAIMKAALVNPVGPPATVATRTAGTPLTVTAHALAAQSWTLNVAQACGSGRVATMSGTAKAGAAITATWDGLVDGVAARPGAYTLTLSSTLSPGPSSTAPATARPVSYTTVITPPASAAAPVPTGPPSAGTGGYVSAEPLNLANTRDSGRLPLGPKGRLDVSVLGANGIPTTGVAAVVLNITTDCPTSATSFTVYPSGTPSTRAVTSVPAGVDRSFLVTSRVGANGEVSIVNAAGVSDLRVDTVGYYAVGGGSPVLPIQSTRVYDSAHDPAGPLVVGTSRTVPLPATIAGVPIGEVTDVMVDLSALSPSGPGSLAVYPMDGLPGTSDLTFRTGQSVDNLTIEPVVDGAIQLLAGTTSVHTVLDVRALVLDRAPGTAGTTQFTPIAPVQALDTSRTGGAVKAGQPRRVVLTGAATGIPATAKAALIDLTALDPGRATWLQAYPDGVASSGGVGLRAPAGDSRGNLIVVLVGKGGAIDVVNARGSTQLRVDVVGYFG